MDLVRSWFMCTPLTHPDIRMMDMMPFMIQVSIVCQAWEEKKGRREEEQGSMMIYEQEKRGRHKVG